MLGQIEELLETREETDRIRVGVAPHAPYSVSPPLLVAAGELARKFERRLSTHLAEVPAEEEFLQKGEGAFQELLKYRGLWDGSWQPPRATPIEYISQHGILSPRTVAAHVNFPREGDLERIKGSGVHVAYCPNSHAYFGHPPHPLPEYLDAGVPLALGTDSLASNDHLSILEELKTLRSRFPDIPAARVLEMATLGGAAALGWQDSIGTLETGKEADLIVVAAPEDPEADPVEHVISSAPEVFLAMVGGRILHERIP